MVKFSLKLKIRKGAQHSIMAVSWLGANEK